MRILITGASSFIGQHLITSILNSGLSLVGTYRNRNEFINALESRLDAPELVQIDICDYNFFH
jgi:nucleoside-diphosphate-sugar epimerase